MEGTGPVKSQQRAYISTVLNPAGIGLEDNRTSPFVYKINGFFILNWR